MIWRMVWRMTELLSLSECIEPVCRDGSSIDHSKQYGWQALAKQSRVTTDQIPSTSKIRVNSVNSWRIAVNGSDKQLNRWIKAFKWINSLTGFELFVRILRVVFQQFGRNVKNAENRTLFPRELERMRAGAPVKLWLKVLVLLIFFE